MLSACEISEAVSRVDWDFHGALSQYSVHRFHWYPATFIPQIPAYLIELLSNPNDVIYDPFCGVGTTLVEAVRLGRRAIGTDVNMVATLASRAKTTFFSPEELTCLCREFIDLIPMHDAAGLFDESHHVTRVTIDFKTLEREFAYLEPWYDPRTFKEMLFLWHLIQAQRGAFRTLLQVTFSQLAKRVSSQRNHWGYVADNMIPKEKHYFNVFGLFTASLRDFAQELIKFLDFPAVRGIRAESLNEFAHVVRGDVAASRLLRPNSVDLVVTSPPYANVTDYTTSQRLSLYWMREDIAKSKLSEVGARWKRFRKHSIDEYDTEIVRCFSNILPCIKQQGYLCIVIGLDERTNERESSVRALKEYILSAGYTMCADLHRTMSRQRVLDRNGSIKKEAIIILQRA